MGMLVSIRGGEGQKIRQEASTWHTFVFRVHV